MLIKGKNSFLKLYVYVWIYAHERRCPARSEEGIRYLASKVTNSIKLPNVGAEKSTGVFCQSVRHP